MIPVKVLVWDEDEHRLVGISFPESEIKQAEKEMGGKLVVDPSILRALHIAFVRHMKERGQPPEVVRCVIEPMQDFYYKRIAIMTLKGLAETNCNLYFSRPRAFFAA